MSQTFQTVFWIVPMVQIVHLLCIALVVSSVLMIELRLMDVVSDGEPVWRVQARFRPVIWGALPVLLITGGLLIVAEPSRSLENPAFAAKMVLLVLALAAMQARHRMAAVPAGRSTRRQPVAGRFLNRAAGVVTLLLWAGVVFAGRWIAYVQGR